MRVEANECWDQKTRGMESLDPWCHLATHEDFTCRAQKPNARILKVSLGIPNRPHGALAHVQP